MQLLRQLLLRTEECQFAICTYIWYNVHKLVTKGVSGMNDDYSKVTCIDMELRNGYFSIRNGDSFKLENDNIPILSYVEKGIWHIVSDPDPNAKGYFTLYLPHGFMPYKLRVKGFNSTIKIGSVNAVDVEIENNNSDISIGCMKLRNIYINVGKGRMYAELTPELSTYVNCGFGEVKLIMTGDKENYRIRSQRGGGSVTLDGVSLEREWDNSVCSDNELVIKCGLGKVDIDFKKEKNE